MIYRNILDPNPRQMASFNPWMIVIAKRLLCDEVLRQVSEPLESAEPRKKQTVDGFEGPSIDLGTGPFVLDDRDLIEGTVAPLAVSDGRFIELIEEMNNACRVWALERIKEVAPTERNLVRWYTNLARKSSDLAELLRDAGPKSDVAPVSEPEQHFPAIIPYDEEWVSERVLRNDGLEHLPDDPTADADGSLPWHLDRFRNAFDIRYFGDPQKPKPFQFGNEAILELSPLLLALARAATDEKNRILRESKTEVAASGLKGSANHQLFLRLVPVYETLFGKPIARSNNPVGDRRTEPSDKTGATGPAIRFFRLIFDMLGVDDAPADNTFGTWIFHSQNESKQR